MGRDQAAPDALQSARELLASALELAPEELAEDAAIGRVGSWDSLAHMRLIMALEEHLGRSLPPDTMVAIGSLADVVAVLEGRTLGHAGY